MVPAWAFFTLWGSHTLGQQSPAAATPASGLCKSQIPFLSILHKASPHNRDLIPAPGMKEGDGWLALCTGAIPQLMNEWMRQKKKKTMFAVKIARSPSVQTVVQTLCLQTSIYPARFWSEWLSISPRTVGFSKHRASHC